MGVCAGEYGCPQGSEKDVQSPEVGFGTDSCQLLNTEWRAGLAAELGSSAAAGSTLDH